MIISLYLLKTLSTIFLNEVTPRQQKIDTLKKDYEELSKTSAKVAMELKQHYDTLVEVTTANQMLRDERYELEVKMAASYSFIS